MYSNRRVLAALLGGLVLLIAAAACQPDRPHRPPGTPTTGTTARVPDTLPGTINCGSILYSDVTGYPTTRYWNPTLDASCLLNALEAGRRARFVSIDRRDDQRGLTGYTYYDVLGPEQLRIIYESGLVQECRTASVESNRLVGHNCTPQPPAAPPLVGTDCGTIAYASGWPTTMLVDLQFGAGKCFLDAWAAGQPARVTTRDQTDGQGGHIRIVIYDVLGAGQLRVITDSRQAVGAGGITTQRCTSLTASMTHLQPGGCTPA
jgi:hypothetical protein